MKVIFLTVRFWPKAAVQVIIYSTTAYDPKRTFGNPQCVTPILLMHVKSETLEGSD